MSLTVLAVAGCGLVEDDIATSDLVGTYELMLDEQLG